MNDVTLSTSSELDQIQGRLKVNSIAWTRSFLAEARALGEAWLASYHPEPLG